MVVRRAQWTNSDLWRGWTNEKYCWLYLLIHHMLSHSGVIIEKLTLKEEWGDLAPFSIVITRVEWVTVTVKTSPERHRPPQTLVLPFSFVARRYAFPITGGITTGISTIIFDVKVPNHSRKANTGDLSWSLVTSCGPLTQQTPSDRRSTHTHTYKWHAQTLIHKPSHTHTHTHIHTRTHSRPSNLSLFI